MLRSIVRSLEIIKPFSIEIFKFRSCSTALPLEQENKDFSSAKIRGTITSPINISPDGTKSMIVRTQEGGKNFANHTVNIKTNDEFSNGQRIFIHGNLRSKSFKLDDGKTRQKLVIKATHDQLSEFDKNQKSRDINDIKIQAQIYSNIEHNESYSAFTLKANYIGSQKGPASGSIVTDFHRVLVYDEKVLEIVKDLNKHDRVQVNGKICYRSHLASDGKKQYSGVIISNHIKRIDDESSNQNVLN